MGFWSGLRSLFGGSDKVGEAAKVAVTSIRDGIDMLVLTEEERIQYSQKAVESYLKFMDMSLDQNSIRAVTRRWLAWPVVALDLMLIIASGVTFLFNEKLADHLFSLSEMLSPWAGGIMMFYFGTQIFNVFKKDKGE